MLSGAREDDHQIMRDSSWTDTIRLISHTFTRDTLTATEGRGCSKEQTTVT